MEKRSSNDVISINDRQVSGYAVVFESYSKDLGGFKEIISREALNDVIEKSDVLAVLDHNPKRGVLARSKYGAGSLTLSIDDKGLKYAFCAPKTALGDELLEGIKRGDISTSSFAFTIEKEQWAEDYTIRRIEKIKQLYDVSPVYQEAYPDTSVAIKSRQDAIDLDKYYKTLENEIAEND